jgi:aryl carrier-like protein
MYGTGDLVKWLADGNIEFIGRVDDQVKIRGYRVELGEIESILQQIEGVSQAVVLAKEDKQGNKRLVAYIVAGEAFDRELIIAGLKEKLPEYMIPAVLMELESLPLTPNGKVDRKALPDPGTTEMLSHDYTPFRNKAEEVLTKIWQDLLDVDRVGIHDNFFELGGDSIVTIQLVSRARREGYELQVGDVFTYQTIARLASLLDQRKEALFTSTAEQFELTGTSGLVPIQQWYLDKNPVDISHFNQSVLLSIDKGITASVIKHAIEQLTAHHDALRFKYYRKNGEWQQSYGAEVNVVFTEDLNAVPQALMSAKITDYANLHQQSLDIEKGN